MVSDIISIFSSAIEFCFDTFSELISSTGMLPLFLTMFVLFCLSSLIAPLIVRLKSGSGSDTAKSKNINKDSDL